MVNVKDYEEIERQAGFYQNLALADHHNRQHFSSRRSSQQTWYSSETHKINEHVAIHSTSVETVLKSCLTFTEF